MLAKLKPLGGRVVALVILAVLAGGCMIDFESPPLPEHHVERLVQRSFSISRATVLEVRNLAGEMVIEGHDGELEIVATLHAGGDSEAEAEELLAAIDVEIEEGDGRLTVLAAYPVDDQRRFFYPGNRDIAGLPMWLGSSRTTVRYQGTRVMVTNSPRGAAAVWVDFVLRVPENVSIEVRNIVGSIDATGVPGALEAYSASGDINVVGGTGGLVLDTGAGDIFVSDYEGDVRADTGSGDVAVEQVTGSVWADTGSGDVDFSGVVGTTISADTGAGDVTLEDVAGSISCDTGSGDVEGEQVRVRGSFIVDKGSGEIRFSADLVAAESVELDTGSGDVYLRLLSEVPSLRFNVHTSSGDISVRLPGLEQRDTGRRRFRGQTGDGHISVVIRTTSGDVTVRF